MKDTIQNLIATAINEFDMSGIEACRAVRDKLIEVTPMDGPQAANAVRLAAADLVDHEFSSLELKAMKANTR